MGAAPVPPFRHAGELLDRLGRVPAWRVCLDPTPGTAARPAEGRRS